MELASLFSSQLARYPACEMSDLLKALYQSTMGCGHFTPEEAQAAERLEGELSALAPASEGAQAVEPLGAYSRVHLSPAVRDGLAPRTLLRLFLSSAEPETPQRRAQLEQAVREIPALSLPFPQGAVRQAVEAYLAQDCPPLHHSPAFRAAYTPAYRLVRTGYAQLLPLLCRIDALTRMQPHVIVAIDGPCASGKTTLAALLTRLYDADTLHMDDYFLQPHQRTPERLAQPGGNVDAERFLADALAPLCEGRPYLAQRYDCQTQTLLAGETRTPRSVTIVEGSYSLHPALAQRYTLRVLLQIDAQAQRARILRRNGAQMLERFDTLWIPLENAYFAATDAAHRCDLLLRVMPDAHGDNEYEVIDP